MDARMTGEYKALRPQDLVSIDDQIAEVERECSRRKTIYKPLIQNRTMTTEEARTRVINMMAVRETLIAHKHGSKPRGETEQG